MTKQVDLPADDLLAQGTCAVLIGGKVKGTAWLVSDEGHLLTAGHILGEDQPLDEVSVRFPEEQPREAHKIQWGYQQDMGVDFAVLKLANPRTNRRPLPVSLAEKIEEGRFRLRGYGRQLWDQSPGMGDFLGVIDLKNTSDNRLFKLRSPELGEKGYSGGAVFSDELRAVVAVQIEATTAKTGPGRDTILAMPLYRIAERWEPLVDLVTHTKSLQSNYEQPVLSEGAYEFENRDDDLRKIFSYLENEPYFHLYGPSGIGKTYLVEKLRQQRYAEHHCAYLDFNERKFRAQSRRVEDLLREIERQCYNTTLSRFLGLDDLTANISSKAKETSRYGVVILDNIDGMLPRARRQLREETLPALQDRIADPTLYLRIIAISQTSLKELSGRGRISFKAYALAEFPGVVHHLNTYKKLLRQAVERSGGRKFDPHDSKDNDLLRRWANELYHLTAGHPGAIEGTLNYIGRQTQFAWHGVFEQQRHAICLHVLTPLVEEQVQGCLRGLEKHQKAFQRLWIFRYLPMGIFRQLLKEVKGESHWDHLNAITHEDDYIGSPPLWRQLNQTPLLQGKTSRPMLSHSLTPIWRQLGNQILQVTDPTLYRKLHADARGIFEYFADQSTLDRSMRTDCFVEELYHRTQEVGILSSNQLRHHFTRFVVKRLEKFLSTLNITSDDFFDEPVYTLNDLLEGDQELRVELNRIGQPDTQQQLINIIECYMR